MRLWCRSCIHGSNALLRQRKVVQKLRIIFPTVTQHTASLACHVSLLRATPPHRRERLLRVRDCSEIKDGALSDQCESENGLILRLEHAASFYLATCRSALAILSLNSSAREDALQRDSQLSNMRSTV
jgi:hypothetical protein